MQAAAEASDGSMVSLLGLDEEKVRALCDEAAQGEVLVPVNFNCPGQIVISGAVNACKRAEQLAEKYGAMKAVPLAVAGAFHSSMMGPAARQLEQALAACPIKSPVSPKVIANITADYYDDDDAIRKGLVKQLVQPILWQKCMERLLSEGVDTFYEMGPGRVLTGLMKRIHLLAKVVKLSSWDYIQEFLNA
jgi:[acyl-carrier-protein] S-malonyltransferase